MSARSSVPPAPAPAEDDPVEFALRNAPEADDVLSDDELRELLELENAHARGELELFDLDVVKKEIAARSPRA